MSSVIKKRKRKISRHKYRKRLKRERHKRKKTRRPAAPCGDALVVQVAQPRAITRTTGARADAGGDPRVAAYAA